MTESKLEQELRDWFRAQVPNTQSAPIRLHNTLSQVVAGAQLALPPQNVLDRLRGLLSNRALQFTLASATAVVVAVVALAILVQRAPNIAITPAPALPSFTARPTSSPSAEPTASPSADRSPGKWALGVPMNGARAFHTSTLLADGRVLVTGGSGPHGVFKETGLASAEIYDPVARTWKAVADMSTPRVGHTATLLSDGRVLIAGGYSADAFHPNTADQTAEVYDPDTDTWTATGSMSIGRRNHFAVLLHDGRVLVAGGEEAEGAIPAAEIWDPRDGSWSSTGTLPGPISLRIPVVLPDGKVLVAGDYDGTGNGLPYSQIYDPRSDEWLDTEPMTRVLWGHTLTALSDGRVLVVGGQEPGKTSPSGGSKIAATAELYDPVTGMWNPTGSLTVARLDQQAVLLNDGAVLVVGGNNVPDGGEQFGEIYVPADGTWTPTGSVVAPRRWFSATVLLDGSVLVTGGQTGCLPDGSGCSSTDSTEIFDPAAQ